MLLTNCKKCNLLENPVVQWMYSGLGSGAFQFYHLDLQIGRRQQLEIPAFPDYHHLWFKRKQITVVEVECTVKREGEEKEAGGGRRWPAPLRGTLKILLCFTEGLKVMLHKHDSQQRSLAQHSIANIVTTLFRLGTTLFQHCNDVLHQKSSLWIFLCNVTFTPLWFIPTS